MNHVLIHNVCRREAYSCSAVQLFSCLAAKRGRESLVYIIGLVFNFLAVMKQKVADFSVASGATLEK